MIQSFFVLLVRFGWQENDCADFLSCHYSFPTHLKRAILLFSSITLHNIPEGLVIGVAFGLNNNLYTALILTFGIAIFLVNYIDYMYYNFQSYLKEIGGSFYLKKLL